MKPPVFALLLAAAPLTAPANTLPSWQECKETLVGPTGIMVVIKSTNKNLREADPDQPHVTEVTQALANTPAAGKFEAGDVLLSVNGVSLKVRDPRHLLGEAINAAEGADGKMTFSVSRGGAVRSVTIRLEPIGKYSPTFPIHCKKSQRIIDDTARFILAHGGPSGGITGDLEALFLMSTGQEKYMPAVRKYAYELAGKSCGTSTWFIGYSGVFLGEYYLATGDKKVLPAIKARCDQLAAGQWFGGWGHGTTNCNPGYVTGGTLNAAGDQALTTLVLARECGLRVNPKVYDRAIIQFFRFAGRGGVPYGDHHPELWWSSNGKNGGLASALTLLPARKFQAGAQLLALSETDTYFDSETGHGSTFGNATWRNIVDALIIDVNPTSWRRHKDKMIWYLEISRMPGGGFRSPNYPGYGPIGRAPKYQTGLLAMAYTAHRKHLRICGKPRTKYSVPYKPTPGELAAETDDFHRTDYVDGVDPGLEPHEIAAVFKTPYNPDGTVRKGRTIKASLNNDAKKKMPPQWYFKLMHHYSPTVRCWAAHGLGFVGAPAIGFIAKALQSKDGRLRVAGLNAISCATGWSPGKTKSNITPEMIKKHFLTHIVKTLRNKRAPTWERRQALMALSCADTEDIKAHVAVIKPYFLDKEWWLRVAAFKAVEPLIGETEAFRALLPAMIASYDAERSLPARRWGSVSVLRKAVQKNPELADEVVAAMAKSVRAMPIRSGFHRAIDINNIFETLRYVNMKRKPANAIPILPAIERVYPDLQTWPAVWVVIGARWGNIGLAKAADKLGKDGAPFIRTMKRIYPNLAGRDKSGKHGKELQKAQDLIESTVKAWEAKYGKVSTR